jgi:hypothetical protein
MMGDVDNKRFFLWFLFLPVDVGGLEICVIGSIYAVALYWILTILSDNQ